MLDKLIDKYIKTIECMLSADDVSATKIVSLTKVLIELIKLNRKIEE